jgi:hypothetical protein
MGMSAVASPLHGRYLCATLRLPVFPHGIATLTPLSQTIPHECNAESGERSQIQHADIQGTARFVFVSGVAIRDNDHAK